jgi:hypothetical protein
MNDKVTSKITPSQYDLSALDERIRQWRDEADRATSETMRRICLIEMRECERRLRRSLATPMLREKVDVDR